MKEDLLMKYLINLLNTQIVLNTYEAEELVKREGFHFNHVEVSAGQLDFYREDKMIYSLELADYQTFEIAGDFKNYFKLFIDDDNWLELYFP